MSVCMKERENLWTHTHTHVRQETFSLVIQFDIAWRMKEISFILKRPNVN